MSRIAPDAATLAEIELRLAGLLEPSRMTLTLPEAPEDGSVLVEDPGGTPIARLTVQDVEIATDGRAQVSGTVTVERPSEGGVARDRRAWTPHADAATLVAASRVLDAEELAALTALRRPLHSVAVVTSATDEHDVWQLLRALDDATGEATELVILPERDGAEDPQVRAAVLAALAGEAALTDLTGPASSRRVGHGTVVLLTGLSGSGKSTIARALADHLMRTDPRVVTLLDGDEVRRHLSAGLGFSTEDRRTNLLRIAWVGGLCARHGGVALCAPIAPYASVRQEMRELIEPFGRLVLVHVSTPLEVCEARDRKGLYARARAGEITGFTGIDDPYEEPTDADLAIDTSVVSVEDAVAQVAALL